MIPIAEARSLLFQHIPSPRSQKIPLSQAYGHFLLQSIPAPHPHPFFDQTAVDGYALRHQDRALPLDIIGEIPAGSPPNIHLQPQTAIRIFTGAAIPPQADTVVMQEFTEIENGKLLIHDEKLKLGGNIRKQGEQIQKGVELLPVGSELNAAAIGFLASLGVDEVQIGAKPNMGLLITGDEFAKDASEIAKGKIFESNGKMLQAVLAKMGIECDFAVCKDEKERMIEVVGEMAEQKNLLLITGGVSVGDYDFTRLALEENGFEVIFHKVAQKPGKPILFAKRGDKIAFGLPGNPRSVLSCFYQYVYPAIRQIMGASETFLPTSHVPLLSSKRKKADGKTHFLSAKIEGNAVRILDGQGSHMLQSFALADAIVELGAGRSQWGQAELVKVHHLR